MVSRSQATALFSRELGISQNAAEKAKRMGSGCFIFEKGNLKAIITQSYDYPGMAEYIVTDMEEAGTIKKFFSLPSLDYSVTITEKQRRLDLIEEARNFPPSVLHRLLAEAVRRW